MNVEQDIRLTNIREQIRLEEFPEQFMERYYTETYEGAKAAICRFDNDTLSIKLHQFYLNNVKEECHYERDGTRAFTIYFSRYLNEINHADIEYYLEYCLEFFEKEFSPFLYITYEICMQTNFALGEICKNYLKFSGRKDREMLLENIFKNIPTLKHRNPDLNQSLNSIMEIEKNHILKCYELSRNGETFCGNCTPMCWIQKKEEGVTKTLYKRTTPFRT